jgi:lysophospholipase L1-like esterase
MTTRPISFLALGDSYTVGTGVSPAQSWPFQVVRALHERNIVAAPEIIARHGWTTADLLQALSRHETGTLSDLITLLIGVNDHYQGDPPGLYRARFQKLLHWAAAHSRNGLKGVLTLSIPDWSVTPFAADKNREKIQTELEIFNRINRELSLKNGTHYLDITPLSRRASSRPTGLTADGLHPSPSQYALWTESICSRLERLVPSSK